MVGSHGEMNKKGTEKSEMYMKNPNIPSGFIIKTFGC